MPTPRESELLDVDPNGRDPQTVREVGIVLGVVQKDVRRLEHKLDDHDSEHKAEHREMKKAIDANTGWRRDMRIWGSLAKWAIGTNLVAIVGLVIAVLAYLDGRA